MQALEWEVMEGLIYDHEGRTIKGHKSLRRGDNGEPFAVVSDGYRPIRNEQLLEHVAALTENTPLQLEGFAEFRGGRRVLAYLRDPRPATMGSHPMNEYMLIGNSHDKSTAHFMGYVNYVIRCENQFSMVNQQVRVQHTGQAQARLADLIQTTELYYNVRTGMWEEMEQMAELPAPAHEVAPRLSMALFDLTAEQMAAGRMRTQRESLTRAIEREQAAFGENMLGVFNGVTRYVTHDMRKAHAMFGNPFGRAYELNRKALQWVRNERINRAPIVVPVTAAPLVERRPARSDW